MKVTLRGDNGIVAEKYVNADVAVIGRSPKCDVVVSDESLSRQHAKIEMHNGEFFITDLESANGVFIEGERIAPNKRREFKIFNQVTLGILDLSVADVDLTRSDFKPLLETPAPGLTASVTKAPTKLALENSKHIDLHPPRKSKFRKTKERNEWPLRLSLLGSVLLFTFIVAHLYTKVQEAPEPTPVPILKPVPSAKAWRAADEFLTTSDYRDYYLQSGCGEHKEACEELHLSKDHGEGIFKNAHSTFIFYRPSKHLEEPDFQALKDVPQADFLWPFSLYLSSTLVSDYVSGATEQVHLVFVNDEKIPYKVFRMHQRTFPIAQVGLNAVASALNRALQSKDIKELWTTLGQPLPEKELIH